MAKRWQRGRSRRDRRRTGRGEGDRPAEPDEETEGTRDRGDLDEAAINARIDAVSSRFDRPPTADELRAAFSRKRPEDGEPTEEAAPDFVSTYTAESLFAATVDDVPAADPDAEVEDRSRTKGDYYYDPDDAWEVLGLQPGATWEQVSTAHRRLAKLHHPDRLLDATVEEREESEARMREVNVAYSVLRRLTGH